MIRTICSLLFLASPLVLAQADPWLEDFDSATKASAASGKPILVDITGSDWCSPCLKMEAAVFSRSDFLQAAAAKYVLLRLDFPRHAVQTEKVLAQNRRLAERYPFTGFPTYLMMDAQGFLFGQHTGYVPGGVAAFLALSASFETQKATLAGLADALQKSAPGADRAKAQDALFRQAEAWDLTSQYGDLPMKIVAEDKDGAAGLKARYQVYNAYNRLLGTWSELSDFHQAIDTLDGLGAKAQPWPDLHQKILFTKAMIWLNALEDELQAREAFRQARALGAYTATGRRAAELLDQLP
jgi:thiol-disulfide isomerase/thioredoxin